MLTPDELIARLATPGPMTRQRAARWSDAVIRAAFCIEGPTALNRSDRELPRHYEFKVDPTPIYDPEK